MSPHSPRQVDLSISIVHHRNKQLLEQCLDSIYKETSVNELREKILLLANNPRLRKILGNTASHTAQNYT